MWPLVRRRLVEAVGIAWLVGTLAFVLLHLAPGDPLGQVRADPRISAEARAAWRRSLDLEAPPVERYLRYVGGLLRGDLGISLARQRPVRQVLAEALPPSLLLVGVALVASVALALLLGAWQAQRAERAGDLLAGAVTSALGAVPEPWLATLLLALFAAEWRWLPFGGACAPTLCEAGLGWGALIDRARHLVLPAATLTLLFAATLARVHRAAVLMVTGDAASLAARSRGIGARRITWRHELPRALSPLLTVVALSLPALVGGTVFVERVFGWPGMGMLLVDAVASRDYPLLTATAMLGGLLVVLGALLADLAALRLDPRLAAPT
jgi:peptide/nickel transport system permease protein